MDANPPAESDKDLIARIRSSDEQAFELLVRSNYDDLLRYLTSKTRSAEDSEDIMQAVFLRIWRGRESLTIDTTIRAYLFTAARNQLINHFRGEKRAVNAALSYSAELSPRNGSIDVAEQGEITRAVQTALNQLPGRAREIWELHAFQKLTYPEIATMLGLSVNTVKTHMSRALAGLREALGPLLTFFLIVSR